LLTAKDKEIEIAQVRRHGSRQWAGPHSLEERLVHEKGRKGGGEGWQSSPHHAAPHTHGCVLHSWVWIVGPHDAVPVVVRVRYWVPPPHVREHEPQPLQALKEQLGQKGLAPVHACICTNSREEQAELDSCTEGGMANRMRVWVPLPHGVSQLDQMLLGGTAARWGTDAGV
jgi:hypothetical protein